MTKKQNKICKNWGFTLIESLVVVTMMMVIIAVAVSSYSAANKKNRDNKRMADVEKIRMALEVFRQNDLGGSYPAEGLKTVLVGGGYIDSWPVGPKGKAVGDTYGYTRTPDEYSYVIRTITLESTGVGYSVVNP